jgi:mono/diheme cytochrome c family protein
VTLDSFIHRQTHPNHLRTHRPGLVKRYGHRTLLALVLFLWLQPSAQSAEELPDFQTDIAPIFQQHCVRCHSALTQKGDVSLATFDDLLANQYVVAGDPDSSHLLDLLTSVNDQPPAMPKDAPPLPRQQIDLLRRWIASGATWPDGLIITEKPKADASWWSLQPLTASPLNSIDAFIQARLQDKGLSHSAPADRRTLIRRLSFDLHGLPPAPDAVHAFVNDPDPQAYERLVDQMLDSPHYGERFARHWLDIAHYADTHGFERDQRRDTAWRYRDYVIDSINADKSYDRFLQEQIAGDVLWPLDDQAVIATGFLAAGPWDFVGQVETKSDVLRRSARSLDLDDMATQVMTSTMGITINCARCHDHKLDPITQQEYYQLRAVFAGARRSERVVSDQAVKQYDARRSELATRLNQIDFQIGRLQGRGIDLADIVGGGNGLGTGTYRKGIDARTAKIQTRDFGALGNVVVNRFAESEYDFVDGVFIPDGEQGQAVIPVTSTGLTITGLPTTSRTAWDMIRNGPVASQHSPELSGIDFTSSGHSLLGLHANAGITFDLAAIRQATNQGDMRFTARLGYFGASGANQADAWIFVDGRLVAEFRQLKRDAGLQDIDIPLSVDATFLTLVSTDGGNGYGHDQIGFGDPRLQPTTPPELTPEDRDTLARLNRDRIAAQQQKTDHGPPPRFFGIVADETPPETRLLVRGDSESPQGEPLPPAALRSLAMLNPSLGTVATSDGERRAELAKWITHPDNPLTARVIVNRIWQWHFGRGLVDTPSDFGFGGGRPSHPQLLDWLALQLQQNNWSLKAIHRLVLTSAAYQQQSRFNTDAPAAAIDADNRLLWRQNPRRLEAEAIRDSVLFISGKLNLQQGGPGFEDFTYQEAYAPIYTYITADEPALWKRSIYRYIVRTTPDQFLTTLDCPDPANLTARRLNTTTPLQSLALYNNDFMLRQAEYFAQRLQLEAGSEPHDQVRTAFLLALGREPSGEETRLTTEFVAAQGLHALCRSLLNSNEFLYVD